MLGVFFCTVSFPSDGRTNNIKAVLLLLLLLGTVYVDNSVYIYIHCTIYIIIFWCRRWNMFVLVLPVGPSIYYYNNIIIYYILRLLYFVHFRFTRTSCSKLCTPLTNENHNITLVFSSHRRTPRPPRSHMFSQ